MNILIILASLVVWYLLYAWLGWMGQGVFQMNRFVWWGVMTFGIAFWAAVLYWLGWWPLLVFFLGCAVISGAQ